MADASRTSWRGKPMVPAGYEDVEALIKLARRVASQTVDFEWWLDEEGLRSLRAVVHYWGTGNKGQFRNFDAAVTAAITEALGDIESVLVLSKHRAKWEPDYQVICAKAGDGYVLRGYGPFAVVFGYGRGSLDERPDYRQRLGARTAAAIGDAVRQLGWDPGRFQGGQLQPVLNTLYGLKLDHGVERVLANREPVGERAIHFHGPFAAAEQPGLPGLFGAEVAKKRGVYLWTIAVEGREMVWYVGQSMRAFAQRQAEHLRAYLSGEYPTWDPDGLATGRNSRLWPLGVAYPPWPQSLPSFLDSYEALTSKRLRMLRLIRFHFGPLEDDDLRLCNRIEGRIGRYLLQHDDSRVRDFFLPIKLPAEIPGIDLLRLSITSDVPLEGLPAHLEI